MKNNNNSKTVLIKKDQPKFLVWFWNGKPLNSLCKCGGLIFAHFKKEVKCGGESVMVVSLVTSGSRRQPASTFILYSEI